VEALTGIFSAFGLSASAGLNAYIPLLVIALMARFTDWIHLNPPFDTLESPWIIGLLVVLSLVEFFADKVPAVNHVNDAIQTFIRPAAGAIAFAAAANVITELHPVIALGAGLLVAGSVHAVKAVAIRPAVTATTGGVGNTPVSMLEDFLATVVSVFAIILPILIGTLALIFTVWAFYILYRRAERRRASTG
jgi:hypothetical protein